MPEAVSVDEIYTTVKLLSERDIGIFESVTSLEEAYRTSDRRSLNLQSCEKRPGIAVANEKPFLMVLGSPGSGKSTFLRKVGMEALKGKRGDYQHAKIPVFLELRKFVEGNSNVKGAIVAEFDVGRFPHADKFVENALDEDKLLILLDGLDEVQKHNSNAVIDAIQDFVDRYDKNRFIASCRIAAYRSRFRRFTDLVVAEFDDTQIEQFIRNWFAREKDKEINTAKTCWDLLQEERHQAAKELAQTLLLLTFLCLVYENSQTFPDNRSELYRKALRILLEEWAAEKRLHRDPIYDGLHVELEETLLAEIAYDRFESDRLFFDKRELVQEIRDFLEGNLNAPKTLDGEAVLKAIAVQQGIFVERATNVYSFSHLTLQEYLTAEYIVRNNDIRYLVGNHLTDKRWKEVFCLVAGLMRGRNGADDLLLEMERQTQKLVTNPKFRAILEWGDRITAGSKSEMKSFKKRAIAINNVRVNAHTNRGLFVFIESFQTALIKLYYERNVVEIDPKTVIIGDLYNSQNISDAIMGFINIARELETLQIFKLVNFNVLIAHLEVLKAKIPKNKHPLKVRKAFAQQIFNTWLSSLHIQPEWAEISQKELGEIELYFYANGLTIECQRSAMRVSPSVWSGIEDRMLRVPQ